MGRIAINEGHCKGCAYCTTACPYDLLTTAEHLNVHSYHPAVFRDPDKKCTGCMLCAITCPDVAIEVFR